MSVRLPIGAATTESKDSGFGTAAATFGQRSLTLRPLRFVLLACGLIALLFGLWTGLARLGLGLTSVAPQLVEFHGVLMICGFFGTLICIERAVALNRPPAYLIPVLAATGTVALLARIAILAGVAFSIASLALTIASLWNMRQQQSALLAVMPSVAALSWGMGTLIWLADRPLPESTGWWLGFLVLTVAAERLDLSRIVTPPTMAILIFIAAIAIFLIGVALGELERPLSLYMGSGLVMCGGWLLIYDLARRTVRLSGQIRFTALCMLLGYCWLIVAGFELIGRPLHLLAFWYDAAVHAITLGFVLSMVFGHTLIIFPSVLGYRLRYSPALYVPLFLLQTSVVIRTVGDISGWTEIRTSSAFLTIIALICFAATIVVVSIWNRRYAQSSAAKII